MRKFFIFLAGAAVIAPLALATPAVAQNSRDIQRLEERVQEAKARGDWGYAQELERQLNRERLQYQRNHGEGEYNGYNGYYSNGSFDYGDAARTILPYAIDLLRGAFDSNNRGRYYDPRSDYSRGYYDRNGNWHSY